MRGSTALAFLDVLCAAMGAAIVMAVLHMSIKKPIQLPLSEEFILLEITTALDPAYTERIPGPGLRVVPPTGKKDTVDLLSGPDHEDDTILGSAASIARIWEGGAAPATGTGARTTVIYVEIREPVAGTWELRPTMTRWRNPDAGWQAFFESRTVAGDRLKDPVMIESVRVWTRDGELVLGKEGQVGQIVIDQTAEAGPLIRMAVGSAE